MKNVVILYIPNMFFVNGILTDTFEYFMYIYSLGVDINLLIVNGDETTKQRLIEIVEEKYNIIDKSYKNNISHIPTNSLIRHSFDKVLFMDARVGNNLRGLINAKEIIITSNITPDMRDVIFTSKNVTYYGEMPFFYKDIHYKMKMNVDLYKDYDSSDSVVYINSPYNDDYGFVSDLNLKKPYIIKEKTQHLTDMFSRFDEYLYYHANKRFDPKPRLFMECLYYNKKIRYINNHGIKDGSWYRYYDLMEYGLNDRILTENDVIVKRFVDG